MKGKNSEVKLKIMQELVRHTGKHNAISMAELHRAVFGEAVSDKVNETRTLRRLITELRDEGVAICSSSEATGGGYYLAAAGSELEEYCKKLRKRALKLLAKESKLRRTALPSLLKEIQLSLGV